jgi:hypothetical protein
MSLLDLLTTVMDADRELSRSEVSALRGMLHGYASPRHGADVPWQSGLIERPDHPVKTEAEALRERVADLELTVKVLFDMLAERGVVEARSLPARVASAKQQIAADVEAERVRAEAERERAQAERAARTVTCVACGRVVRERESFMSGNGAVCGACHAASEE